MNVKQALSIPVLCAGLALSGQVLAESVMHSTPEGTTKFYPAHDSAANPPSKCNRNSMTSNAIRLALMASIVTWAVTKAGR